MNASKKAINHKMLKQTPKFKVRITLFWRFVSKSIINNYHHLYFIDHGGALAGRKSTNGSHERTN